MIKTILDFIKKNIVYIIGAIAFFLFVLPQGRAMIARAKTWISISKYKQENTVETKDYHLLSVRINDAFHGKWLKENEEAVISIINSLSDVVEFNALVYQYSTDFGHDLRAELLKFMNEKQYSKLKFK